MHTTNSLGENEGVPKYLPTPEEIKKLTAEIRKTWKKSNYVMKDYKGDRSPLIEHKLHISRDVLSKYTD